MSLEKIALKSSTNFSEWHIREDNLEERKENGLGRELANWAGYDGMKLARVFCAALEDANFHTEVAQIEKLFGIKTP